VTGLLLHLADRAEWAAARRDGEYRRSSRGVSLDDEGFIHCCAPDQLAGVGQRHYADVDPATLVVLVVAADRLDAPVRFECAVPGGEAFPHVYGPIPVGAVVQILDVHRGPAGALTVTSTATPDRPAS
jgi:uncharacterized protein (DUF952 family)